MIHDLSLNTSERGISDYFSYDSNLDSQDENTIKVSEIIPSSQINQKKYIQMTLFEHQTFHSLKLSLDKKYEINGLTLRYRLKNWEKIQYMAIGFNLDDEFFHIKISHPTEENWQTFTVGFNDLIFQIQNKFKQIPKTLEVNDFCVKIKGQTNSGGAILDIQKFSFWNEPDTQKGKWIESVQNKPLNRDLVQKIYNYQVKSLKNSVEVSQQYFDNGSCPIVKNIRWSDKTQKPENLESVNTYRYSWHALHHVANMIIYANSQFSPKGITESKKFAEYWIKDSWEKVEEDFKFMWYDHGVAERQFSLIMLYNESIEKPFDLGFINKIKEILLIQGRLLESEIFYASHQVGRYHNHAMFQDLALIVTALCFQIMSFQKDG